MIYDSSLLFDPTGTAITTTNATSTNVLDLVNNRDLGQGMHRGHIICLVGTQFTSGTSSATFQVQLQGAPDNGSGSAGIYETIAESPTHKLGDLAPGYKAAQFLIPSIAQGGAATVTTTLTTTATSTAATVASGTGIGLGMLINSAGVTPGTTVSAISGTSVTLSDAAASTTSAVAAAFTASDPTYRFLRLNYVVSATMTAGKVTSFIAGDVEESTYYPAGVTVAN